MQTKHLHVGLDEPMGHHTKWSSFCEHAGCAFRYDWKSLTSAHMWRALWRIHGDSTSLFTIWPISAHTCLPTSRTQFILASAAQLLISANAAWLRKQFWQLHNPTMLVRKQAKESPARTMGSQQKHVFVWHHQGFLLTLVMSKNIRLRIKALIPWLGPGVDDRMVWEGNPFIGMHWKHPTSRYGLQETIFQTLFANFSGCMPMVFQRIQGHLTTTLGTFWSWHELFPSAILPERRHQTWGTVVALGHHSAERLTTRILHCLDDLILMNNWSSWSVWMHKLIVLHS